MYIYCSPRILAHSLLNAAAPPETSVSTSCRVWLRPHLRGSGPFIYRCWIYGPDHVNCEGEHRCNLSEVFVIHTPGRRGNPVRARLGFDGSEVMCSVGTVDKNTQ
jgi:hypothetical protein